MVLSGRHFLGLNCSNCSAGWRSATCHPPLFAGDSSAADAGDSSPTCLISRRKPFTLTPTSLTRQPASTTFNISTRSSPRKFDTRPYARPDTIATLNTRKGSYAKPIVSALSRSLAEAASADAKRAPSGAKEKQTGQTVSGGSGSAAPEDKNRQSSSARSAAVLHERVETVSRFDRAAVSTARAKSIREKTKAVVGAVDDVPDFLESINTDEEQRRRVESARGEAVGPGGQEECVVLEECVNFTDSEDSSDLMFVNIRELHSLPEQFMSDNARSPMNMDTGDDQLGADAK